MNGVPTLQLLITTGYMYKTASHGQLFSNNSIENSLAWKRRQFTQYLMSCVNFENHTTESCNKNGKGRPLPKLE